jgi:hypothetical protein
MSRTGIIASYLTLRLLVQGIYPVGSIWTRSQTFHLTAFSRNLRSFGAQSAQTENTREVLSPTGGSDSIAPILGVEVAAVPKVKQLTVSCDNIPGSLARVAGIIGGAKVNILALNASAAGAMGYIQFVVDNGAKAKKALKRAGYSCYEEIVLHTTLPNVPGALAQFVKKLSAKNINIGACYQTTVKGSKSASVVLAVSHPESAALVR